MLIATPTATFRSSCTYSDCSNRTISFNHSSRIAIFSNQGMIFSSSSSRTTLSSLALFLTILPSTRADCECGYTVNSTLWTDLVETDFLHLKNINESGWIPQEYSVQPEDARGPFGKKAEISNVATNPLKNKNDWSGDGINGGDAGVQLIVRGGEPPKGGLIPMAEMSTNRTDILYGSFRAGMKLTGLNGTCGAFFWVCAPLITW